MNTVIPTPINKIVIPIGRHGFSYCPLKKTACLMNRNTPKISYDIIRHRRGLLLYDPIQKKYVPNRRGRPKHFVLHKHVQQFLQKRGVA